MGLGSIRFHWLCIVYFGFSAHNNQILVCDMDPEEQFLRHHHEMWMNALPGHCVQYCYDTIYHWHTYFVVCLIGCTVGNLSLILAGLGVLWAGLLPLSASVVVFYVWLLLQGTALGWCLWNVSRLAPNPLSKWEQEINRPSTDLSQQQQQAREHEQHTYTSNRKDRIPSCMIPAMGLAFAHGLQQHPEQWKQRNELLKTFWRHYCIQQQKSNMSLGDRSQH
jgi:hypothetical protein